MLDVSELADRCHSTDVHVVQRIVALGHAVQTDAANEHQQQPHDADQDAQSGGDIQLIHGMFAWLILEGVAWMPIVSRSTSDQSKVGIELHGAWRVDQEVPVRPFSVYSLPRVTGFSLKKRYAQAECVGCCLQRQEAKAVGCSG